MNRGAVAQGAALVRKHAHGDVEAGRRPVQVRRQDPCAAAHVVGGQAGTGQVQRAALPGACGLGHRVVDAHAANPDLACAGRDEEPVAHPHRACVHRPGHDQACPGHGEAPVDGKPEAALSACRDIGAGRGLQQAGKVIDARSRQRGACDDRCRCEPGAGEKRVDLPGHRRDAVRIGAVGLRHRDDAAVEAEKVEDGGVLARLRHHPIVGGDHQERTRHAGGARDHGAHEALVPRHVDESKRSPQATVPRRVSEAEVEGDAPGLLFREPVGVDPRQRLHQGRLAVVDVPCGRDDHAVPRPSGIGCRGLAQVTPRQRSLQPGGINP
jgi:hypothetical protein